MSNMTPEKERELNRRADNAETGTWELWDMARERVAAFQNGAIRAGIADDPEIVEMGRLAGFAVERARVAKRVAESNARAARRHIADGNVAEAEAAIHRAENQRLTARRNFLRAVKEIGETV